MAQGKLVFNGDTVSDVSIFSVTLPSEYSVYEARLNEVTRGVLQSRMTPAWVGYMTAHTENEWISALRAATPKAVKILLNDEYAPSIEDLKLLPWDTTSHFGVYGRAIWNKNCDDCYVYVGSATGRYGLEGRKIRHERINAALKEPSLHHSLLVDPLNLCDGRFFSLLRIPSSWAVMEAAYLLQLRSLAFLGEAVFCAWLSAYSTLSKYESKTRGLFDISPFKMVEWNGVCTHSALTDPVMTLDAMRNKQKKRETKKDIMSREERNARILANREYNRRYRDEHREAIRNSQRKYDQKEKSEERKAATAEVQRLHLAKRKDLGLEPGQKMGTSSFSAEEREAYLAKKREAGRETARKRRAKIASGEIILGEEKKQELRLVASRTRQRKKLDDQGLPVPPELQRKNPKKNGC